jgi:hypothetical protein
MAWLIGCVIVAIVFYFSRKAGIAVLVVLASVLTGLRFTTKRAAQIQPSNQSIGIAVSSDALLCPDPDRPVSVSIINNANISLQNVSFRLFAKERGADPVVYRASYSIDNVLAPGETFSTCYGLNPLSFAIRTINYDPRVLDWAGEVSLTKFGSH